VYIRGIGIVSALGRGLETFKESLESASVPDTYSVSQEVISGGNLSSRMRRADRFSKIAAIASMDAIGDSQVDLKGNSGTLGIVLATAYGPHVTTFKFLDDLISYGEENVSPITFSHSVHNAAVSYITSALESQGPALTIAGFVFSFHQALLVAQSWLDEGRCQNVLVGSIDERGKVSDNVFYDKMSGEKKPKIKPFECSSSPKIDPGEGAAFFVLTNDYSKKKYCKVEGVMHGLNACDDKVSDMCILDTDGMSGDETPYMKIKEIGGPVAGYSPMFGSTPALSALHCVVSALTLKNDKVYISPVNDNPHGLNLCKTKIQANIKSITCIKYNCLGERGYIRLEK
jgi:3-oxoacyl-[acyl-carrier-protein] synthase II